MKTIRARLVVLVVSAAVAPLLAYGIFSMWLLRRGTRESVTDGAKNVAARSAEQIDRYIHTNVDLLEAVAADLQNTSLEPWQQERILRNIVLRFPEFRELTLFDRAGTALVSSRLDAPQLTLAKNPPGPDEPWRIAPIEIDEDLLPETVATVRVDQAGTIAGYLVGALRLEDLWRQVDRTRSGKQGFALLADEKGRLIAHGNPDQKALVARGGEPLSTNPLVSSPLKKTSSPGSTDDQESKEYDAPNGQHMVGVVRPISDLGWRLIIEQPTSEAFALQRQFETFLVLTISLALFSTIVIASFWGRSFLRPIGDLLRGTRALSEGHLQERVHVSGQDEFSTLGTAFNQMAERLVALQAEAVKQERHATFGRIAAGLVHDLAHPIQNIGNNCKLIVKMYDDPEYRATFRKMVDREFAAIKRLLEDLRNLGRPIPLERFPVDVNRSLTEAAERMAVLAEQSGVSLVIALGDDPIVIEGDLFALGRVYRNLLMNGVQATAPGGSITIASTKTDGTVWIRVTDTGCGIAPERLGAIFDEYITTKRRGLGVGLAISKKIVEQLHGTINVESEVGKGTTFTMAFPALAVEAQVPPQPREAVGA